MADQQIPPPAPRVIGKAKPGTEEIMAVVSNEIAKLSRRMSLIENRTDNIQDHLDLVDTNVIEKHKSAISDIRDLQNEVRTLQSQLNELTELIKRAVSRMGDFASKDDIKVIERYMNYWSPLAFTTKSEVKNMIQQATGKALQNGEAHAEISKLVSAQLEDFAPSLTKRDVINLVKQNTPLPKVPSKTEIKEIIKSELSKIKTKGLAKEDVKKLVSKALSSAKFEVKDRDIEALVKSNLEKVKPAKSLPISKKEMEALIKSEISKLKPASTANSSGLTKKEVEDIVKQALSKIPKGSLGYDDVKKITREQMEDLFGKF